MVEKSKQHYVPKFMLRRFSSDPQGKRISVYLVKENRIIPNASLRAQCYKKRYYSKETQFEDELCEIEGDIAATLNEVIENSRLLIRQKQSVAVAIMLQRSRTPFNVASYSQLADKLAKSFLSGKIDANVLNKFSITYKNSALFSVALALSNSQMILDLKQFLILNKTRTPFWISDNPVAITNSFFRNRFDDYAAIGLPASGLQLLMPISPRYAIYLHDSEVYTVPAEQRRIFIDDSRWIDEINRLQYLFSDRCIYVSPNCSEHALSRICTGDRYKPTPEFSRFWASEDGSFQLSERNEYQPPIRPGKELITSRLPAPSFAIRLPNLRVRKKPKFYHDGSLRGPLRDPAWYEITNDYSRLLMNPEALKNQSFWDFFDRHTLSTHVGPWLRRDNRASDFERKNTD